MDTITCHDNGTYTKSYTIKINYFNDKFNSRYNDETVKKSTMVLTSKMSKIRDILMMLLEAIQIICIQSTHIIFPGLMKIIASI